MIGCQLVKTVLEVIGIKLCDDTQIIFKIDYSLMDAMKDFLTVIIKSNV